MAIDTGHRSHPVAGLSRVPAVVAEARAERVPQRRSPGAACPGAGGESRACPELASLFSKSLRWKRVSRELLGVVFTVGGGVAGRRAREQRRLSR
jgi:hypothetical protein